MNASLEPVGTCDQCKLSSPLLELFRRVRVRGGSKNLCPACVAEETRRAGVGALLVAAFAVLVGAAIVALGGVNNAGWFLLNLALLDVMLWLTVLPHEAGHAIAARLLGLAVHRIVVGVGQLLGTLVVRGVPIDLHVLPIGGLTYTEARDEPAARLKHIIVVAAGPLVELAMLAAALRFGGEAALAEDWRHGPAPVTAFIAACVLGLLANLLPARVQTGAGLIGNDGRQLLSLVFARRIPFADMARAATVHRAQMLIVRGQDAAAERYVRSALEQYPNDSYLTVALSAAILNQHRYREGRELLIGLLVKPQADKRIVAVAYNNLAWANLHLPEPALIAEARTLSATAYRYLPWEGYVASTYGCVDALHGDERAALSALQSALEASRRLRKRAPALGGLAVVHARSARWEESAAELARAEALDPTCPFLDLARKRVAQEHATSRAR